MDGAPAFDRSAGVRSRPRRSWRLREAALRGISGVPWASLKGLEGPQRVAMRPTWPVNGLRTANYRRMTALERVMRQDRRCDGAHGCRGCPLGREHDRRL